MRKDRSVCLKILFRKNPGGAFTAIIGHTFINTHTRERGGGGHCCVTQEPPDKHVADESQNARQCRPRAHAENLFGQRHGVIIDY